MPPLQYPKSSRILSFQAKAFPKNVHCNIVKHTTKPHLIGAIENINTIDDYRPKIVRIIVFFITITRVGVIKIVIVINCNLITFS